MDGIYIFGLRVIAINCVTTTDPKSINIVVLGGDIIGLPYTTYQQIREAAGLPDVVCGED